jgi:hypothetical protein
LSRQQNNTAIVCNRYTLNRYTLNHDKLNRRTGALRAEQRAQHRFAVRS